MISHCAIRFIDGQLVIEFINPKLWLLVSLVTLASQIYLLSRKGNESKGILLHHSCYQRIAFQNIVL